MRKIVLSITILTASLAIPASAQNRVMYFGGVDDHVQLPASAFTGLQDGTIAHWVYAETDAPMVSFSVTDLSNNFNFFKFQRRTAHQLLGTLRSGPSSYNIYDQVTDFSFATGTWYHLALTQTGAGLTFYINGEPMATGSSLVTVPIPGGWFNNVPNADTVTIGAVKKADFATSPIFWQGYIDELGVWSRALNGTEIFAL